MFIRGQTYRNTAFVVDTNGVVVFKQAKAQPIQFFRDGIPASRQGVWQSPWGKIGIAICYDVSYRRVMDRLVQMGARALIVPAMDVVDWGQSEHLLNARQSRLRAAEYGLPIFRVASSGISQLITNRGRSESTASYPGQGEMLAGELPLADEPARAPLDVWLAPACCYATGLFVLFLIGERWVKGRSKCPSTEVL